MAMKGNSAFPNMSKQSHLNQHSLLVGGRSYPSAEKQSVYSTARSDWARLDYIFIRGVLIIGQYCVQWVLIYVAFVAVPTELEILTSRKPANQVTYYSFCYIDVDIPYSAKIVKIT